MPMTKLYSPDGFEREPVEVAYTQPVNGTKDFRSDFRKDYGKLVHSSCFRRLQGKTQLFPGIESDFFRNRLTHSIEVAQISKGIAIHLNHKDDLKGDLIDYDLVEFAALAHDLGHPPFGHNGEAALHEICHKKYGFEGNAQTLRILSTLANRVKSNPNKADVDKVGKENRMGLNLTYRSLAAVLKYDNEIPISSIKLSKGFYYYDSELVKRIKQKVTGYSSFKDPFKTIECYIMDVADDIAYSTYDLEDSLKAGFISILDIAGPKRGLMKGVAEKVNKGLKKYGFASKFNEKEILFKYLKLFTNILGKESLMEAILPDPTSPYIINAGELYDQLAKIGTDGYSRTYFSSQLVNRFINGVRIDYNKDIPALSKVYLCEETRAEVEVLKNLVYISQIESPRLKISEFRGKEIVTEIFNAILKRNGSKLMPDDFRKNFDTVSEGEPYRDRIVVDFIAGMTDRYAIEFYGRLKSENPQTIFKPIG